MHAPSQPLMRSLLLQFQTPTAPRRVSRFFRVWSLSGLPRLADHPAYFGLAKFYLSQPFQPSTCANLNSSFRDVNAILIAISHICGCCVEKQDQSRKSRQEHAGEPIQCLDWRRYVTHCCSSTRSQNMSDLVAYIDGGSLGNPGPSGIGVVIDGSGH